MKSTPRGATTSGVEVTNVSPNGLWVLIDEKEIFLAFSAFPWFEHASIAELTRVERPSTHHLYWPALDVDLAVDSLLNPDKYPLVSRAERKRPTKKAVVRRSKVG